MADNYTIQNEIKIMQTHLRELRKLAGWTSEELGMKLGMTKQAVSALENGSTTMNQLHYLALVHLFETEISENSDNEALKKVMEILFSDPEYYEEHKQSIDPAISNVAGAISGGVTGAAVGVLVSSLLLPLIPISPLIVGTATVIGASTDMTSNIVSSVSSWSRKIMKLGKKSNKHR